MRYRSRFSITKAAALCALVIASCQSPSPEHTEPHALLPGACEAGERDPGLDNLGLVYDDTVITTSARTVDFNGQAVVPRYIHRAASGGGKDLAVDAAVAKVVFGFHKDFTVSVGVPFLSKRLAQSGGSPTLRSEGFGDTAVVGKYRFYQDTGTGETTEAAVLFGVEAPTGREGVRSAGVLLAQPLQPGSSSWDAIIGGAFTRIKGRWLLNADLIAKINTEANDYQFGNTLRFDVGGHFRAYPARYVRYDQMTVNVVAELNGTWSDRNESAGVSLVNSGGTKLFATPGLQVIVSDSLLFEGAIQIPVLMDLNGTQLEEDFVTVFGLRFRF